MNCHASRFIQHEQVLILIEDFYRDLFGYERGGLQWRFLHGNLVTTPDQFACPCRFSVEQDVPLANQVLHSGAG